MAAPNLIHASNTAGLTALEIGDRLVVQEHQTLFALLESRLGAGYAQMFAEPALGARAGRKVASVSWYTQRPGAAVSFDRLGPAERAEAEEQLRQRMDRLTGLFADSQHGALLQRALIVPHVNDIYWVNGTAVLTNWGFVPQAVAPSDSAQMDAQWRTTLGRFARGGASPWLAAAGGGGASKASEALTVLRGVASAPRRAPEPGAATPWYMRPLAWGICGVLLVAVGLFTGLGIRLAQRDAAMPLKHAEALLAAQEALNRSLRRQIDDLRKVAGGNVCTAADPQGALGAPHATLGRVEGEPAPATGMRLATLLDAAIVLISVERGQGIRTYATGFFVSPTFVLTTRDAVDGAKPDQIRLSNAAFGGNIEASVKASTPSDGAGRNYALLVTNPPSGRRVTPLAFAGQVTPLNEVVVAGHIPALPAAADAQPGAAVEPTYVAGAGMIAAVERAGDGKPGPGRVLYAGLGVSGGGPLVDRCGRVVAMRSGAKAGDKAMPGIALSADDLVAWLGENGVKVTASTARCAAGGA